MRTASSNPHTPCADCAALDGATEPWCEVLTLPSSDRAEEWSEGIELVAGFAGGAAHSAWFNSDLSDVLIRMSCGYDRLRLEIATVSSFGEDDRASLARRGLLRVARDPDLAVVTKPETGEVVRTVIVHEETWVWTGEANEVRSAMRTVYWALTGPMALSSSDEFLLQVVQRERSCQRCWEIVAHDFPY